MTDDHTRRVILDTVTTLPEHLTIETAARIAATGVVFLDWTVTDRAGHVLRTDSAMLSARSARSLVAVVGVRGRVRRFLRIFSRFPRVIDRK